MLSNLASFKVYPCEALYLDRWGWLPTPEPVWHTDPAFLCPPTSFGTPEPRPEDGSDGRFNGYISSDRTRTCDPKIHPIRLPGNDYSSVCRVLSHFDGQSDSRKLALAM